MVQYDDVELVTPHKYIKNTSTGASLVAQWLRIRLQMQGPWV